MFHFFKKYSPHYGRNNLEGWSVILVAAIGFQASTFANSWLETFGLFVGGVLCAHIAACIIKFFITKLILLRYNKQPGSFPLHNEEEQGKA